MKKSPLLGIIRGLPDGAFAHLCGQSSMEAVQAARERLATWCAAHPDETEWRRAWSLMLSEPPAPAADAPAPEPRAASLKSKAKAVRHEHGGNAEQVRRYKPGSVPSPTPPPPAAAPAETSAPAVPAQTIPVSFVPLVAPATFDVPIASLPAKTFFRGSLLEASFPASAPETAPIAPPMPASPVGHSESECAAAPLARAEAPNHGQAPASRPDWRAQFTYPFRPSATP